MIDNAYDHILLSIENLRVNFRVDKHNSFQAFKGISLDVMPNQTAALAGESGSRNMDSGRRRNDENDQRVHGS